MLLAFTGTRHGLTSQQHRAAAEWLVVASVAHLAENNRFLCGCCAGADRELLGLGLDRTNDTWAVELHPGDLEQAEWARGLLWRLQREKRYYTINPLVPYLERNRTMAQACDHLLATPRTMTEVKRSGTWATVRYARQAHKRITIVLPDGSVQNEDHTPHSLLLEHD